MADAAHAAPLIGAEEARPADFAFLGGVGEGQQVLERLMAAGWRPGVILALDDAGLAKASGGRPWPASFAGATVTKVPSFQSTAALWALGSAGVKGVLAVGISEILRAPFLATFPFGVYGFHASLLPELAGPAPVNWAIIQGRTETGTTLLRLSPEVDGGTIVAQRKSAITAQATAATMYQELAQHSAAAWLEAWPRVARGSVIEAPLGALQQNLRRRPEDGRIRWAQHSTASLDRWIRGLARPYPGAYFWLDRQRIWVHAIEKTGAGDPAVLQPMLRAVTGDAMDATFADGNIRLTDLRADGDAPLPAPVLAALRERIGEPLRELGSGRRVLAIVAHPDDEVLGGGGALIEHFKHGDDVRVVLVCSADPVRYAPGDHDQPGDFRRALHYLGAEGRSLGFADQRLDAGSNLELIQALEREIQEFRPHVVYTHFWGDVNADHVRIAEAVDVATRPYSAPFIQQVLAFETPSSTEWTASGRSSGFLPNFFVNIADAIDRKADAMRCYRSELRPYPHPRSLRALRQRAAYWGSVANFDAAEAFQLLRSRV